MFGPFGRMATGGAKSLTHSDHTYFTKACPRSGRTRFREDVRAIIGGALAAAFIAAWLTSLVHVPLISDGTATAVAAAAGGLAGKFFLA
jgi:hypothetical protein